ncbi:MAG: ATP-binding cassette domain-containing protein, partial [Clostridia bacterium]|nr:ATP-binding cassette domain-containing protein [Clostridia bacterium]
MLVLKNINYSVSAENKTIDILKNINLKFNKGINVITGQNGSGKSTLIKLIMGINTPTSGQIVYNNVDISNTSINERANLGFTLAFQQPVKFKGIKVKDLLDIASSKSNKLSDICEHLSKVGMCAKDYINRELDSTLSGGELKRIELAMALAKGGEVFLFDEPEAGIDLWSFENLIDIFKNLKNKIVVIVSHQEKII